jgi:4-amino-4-deoxy-L-arabinose transferase-like glycosyltransferase
VKNPRILPGAPQIPRDSRRLAAAANHIAALPNLALLVLFFAAVAFTHLTLLRLPYYWDEGGYYIPAALDFYRTGALIPHFTNAHPPLPNVLLGTLWHITGFHIAATRLFVCAFAAAALLAVFRLTQRLLNSAAAIAVTFLTACYPIWFAQSTLAHADIFAAAFTLAGFAIYLPAITLPSRPERTARRGETRSFAQTTAVANLFLAIFFTLATLSKETAILQPATLACLELFFLFRTRRSTAFRQHLHTFAALCFPALPLLAWYTYHHAHTGFTFGNPEYLRYNATANFTAMHILTALRYRFGHLFWQRNIWLPILLALACLLLPRRAKPVRNHKATDHNTHDEARVLDPQVLRTIALLIATNWLAFSILGGALLTRYLLPIYPLILLVCVAVWNERVRLWPLFAAFTAAAFISALWLNPPTAFAPEDNLTYRDMIVVHQQAIAFIDANYPNATVLTAWPASTELFEPDLGYTNHPIKVDSITDFSSAQIYKAARDPGAFDTALIFTTHYASPALQSYMLMHPGSFRGAEFARDLNLSPFEAATILGGRIVWGPVDLDGERAAVLRFDRAYDASAIPSSLPPLRYTHP